jgi:hypothetical protein
LAEFPAAENTAEIPAVMKTNSAEFPAKFIL